MKQYTSFYISKEKTQIVGTALAEIERKGELTPNAVLQSAKNKGSPLHNFFEWNDGIAADSYRLQQAAWLIRTVKVTISTPDKNPVSVRAFVRVVDDEETHYVPIDKALKNDDWKEQLLEDARRELQSFKNKYSILSELTGVIREIDKVFQPIYRKPKIPISA